MTARRCVNPRCAEHRGARCAISGTVRGVAVGLIVSLAGCGSAPAPRVNAAQHSAAALSQGAAKALARGDLALARAQYEGALAAAESVEDFDLAGAALLNLALVHQRSGELAAGHARVDRILAAPQRYGSALHARAAARKALLLLDSAERDAALRWADAAQADCAAPCELDATLDNLRAHIALERGDAAAAATLASRAASIAGPAAQPAEQANALRLLGRAQTRQGDSAGAAAALAQALALDRQLGLPERLGLDLLYAGDNELSRRQFAAAREYFERAIDVFQAAGLTKSAELARARLAAVAASRMP